MLFAALWLGVAVQARGTALVAPALLAAASSLALTLWLTRERRRLTRALAQAQVDNQRHEVCAALIEAAVSGDLRQVLAHCATLLDATRAWLRVEPYVGAPDLDWPDAAAPDAPWWQARLVGDELSISDAGPPARCALALSRDGVRLGVLAFEKSQLAGDGFNPAGIGLLPRMAALMSQQLLRLRLEQALAQASEQDARERRVFLSKLSHKLRTPMTAVLGFAQILALEDSLNAEHREFVREIETAGQALLDMLNELVGVPRE